MKQMSFIVPCVKTCLIENKKVFTVRKWKSYDSVSFVEVEGIGVCKKTLCMEVSSKVQLQKFLQLSGFQKLNEWWEKISDFIPQRDKKFLYKVEIC